MRYLLSLSTAIAVFCVASVSARADIIIQNLAGGGNPDENILFNGHVTDAGGNLGPATTVQGITNQSGLLLDIMSGKGGPDLLGSGGAAELTEANSQPFGSFGVMFFNHDFDFITDFKFNINASADGTLTIDVFDDEAGTTLLQSATYDLDKNGLGANWFRVTGTNGDDFAKVTITTNGDIISDIRHIRISGGGSSGETEPPPPAPLPETPEPSSILLWSVLTLAAGVFVVRRRRVNPVLDRSAA